MATTGIPTWPWTEADVDALPAAERLLIDGMRLWAEACRRQRPTGVSMRLPFVAENAAAAATQLDALLHYAIGLRPLAFGCAFCQRVAPDERSVLIATALAQRGARREALAALAGWLPPAAACAAMPPVIRLGAALRGAGLLLERPFPA